VKAAHVSRTGGTEMPRRSWACPLVLLAAGCMEQAKPQPLPRRPTLYARLGGEPALGRVVNDFVAGAARGGPAREFFEKGGDALRHELVGELGGLLGGPQPARRDKLLEMFRAAGPQHAGELERQLADAFAKPGARDRGRE